ncbi:MAG: winged helix DNA-binding domain-containing protein, partial [Fibrella sp.]|nr:winged helix DNA-binding domain-containing protein [Armatimonadota bacterium]
GPLFLRDAKALGEAHGHTISGWGTKTRLLSFVADKLFWQGRLGIAKRDGFLRAFDRIERLLPEEILNTPSVSDAEADAYLLRKRLRARRLFRLRPADKALLGENETTPIQIETDKRPWHILTEDLPQLITRLPNNPVTQSPTLHFLAPLDPLVYDRDRTRLLWDFDYTWEVYVPQEKRKWGYYVLPILWGDRLVGRIEPRLEKRSGAVNVVSLHWEPGFDGSGLGDALKSRLADFASLAC